MKSIFSTYTFSAAMLTHADETPLSYESFSCSSEVILPNPILPSSNANKRCKTQCSSPTAVLKTPPS